VAQRQQGRAGHADGGVGVDGRDVGGRQRGDVGNGGAVGDGAGHTHRRGDRAGRAGGERAQAPAHAVGGRVEGAAAAGRHERGVGGNDVDEGRLRGGVGAAVAVLDRVGQLAAGAHRVGRGRVGQRQRRLAVDGDAGVGGDRRGGGGADAGVIADDRAARQRAGDG